MPLSGAECNIVGVGQALSGHCLTGRMRVDFAGAPEDHPVYAGATPWPDLQDRRRAVFLRNGKYLCTLCGAELDISDEERPLAMIRASSGQPNVRTITLHGRVVHACPLDPAEGLTPTP